MEWAVPLLGVAALSIGLWIAATLNQMNDRLTDGIKQIERLTEAMLQVQVHAALGDRWRTLPVAQGIDASKIANALQFHDDMRHAREMARLLAQERDASAEDTSEDTPA